MKLTSIRANMNEVEIGDKTVLFSYQTPVAYQELTTEKMIYVKTNKKWSKTTTRHINQWFAGVRTNEIKEVDQSELDKLMESM